MKNLIVKYLASILASVLLIGSAFAGIGSPPYNPANVAITGGTINNVTQLESDGTISLNGKLLISATAPTIASGFGATASITSSSGTANFIIFVASGATTNVGVLNMPAASTGYSCTANQVAGAYVNSAYIVTTTTTTVTITSLVASSSAAYNFPTGIYLQVMCFGR